jgi:hypothetical protein
MSLLDDLKSQAEHIKAKEHARQQAEEDKDRQYREEILPKLEYVYGYLSELAEHLNCIVPDVYVSYDIAGKAKTPDLKQVSYEINVDSRKAMTRIDFEVTCEAEGETAFDIEGKKNIDHIRELLIKSGIKFEFKMKMNDLQVTHSGRFIIKNKVPARLSFIAEPEQGKVVIQLRNFDALGTHRMVIQPAQLTDEMMDRLGRYILREMSDFLQLEISEQDRHQIKEMLEKDRHRRQMELREAEWREQVEQARLEKEREKKLVNRVRKNLTEKTEKLGGKLGERISKLIKR